MQSKAQIDQILRQKSEAREIPGVVAMATTGNEVIYQGAFGKRDLSKDDPMTADSVFWIASMTKAVTTAAGMQLVEQGKLPSTNRSGSCCPIWRRRRCWKVLTPRAIRSCAPQKRRSRCAI